MSIVLVGKYTALKDSYMSVTKSLEHSAVRCGRKLILEASTVDPAGFTNSLTTYYQWIESSDLEQEMQETDPRKYHDAHKALVSAK